MSNRSEPIYRNDVLVRGGAWLSAIALWLACSALDTPPLLTVGLSLFGTLVVLWIGVQHIQPLHRIIPVAPRLSIVQAAVGLALIGLLVAAQALLPTWVPLLFVLFFLPVALAIDLSLSRKA